MSFAELYDFIFHLEHHLKDLVDLHPILIYGFFATIIFVETGLVVMPFLPGDSFLFVIGTFAAVGVVDITIVNILLIAAGILGNLVNYSIGRAIGPRAFDFPNSKFFNKKMLITAHNYYQKHGGKTIIISRFIPFVRTFAPFVAGIGEMHYLRFIIYNIIGALCWVLLFTLSGYFFGQVPWVKNNFSILILLIIIISVMPIFYGVWKSWRNNKVS